MLRPYWIIGGNIPHTRALAICTFSRSSKTFYRPLGGDIEFGEYSEDASHRELMEEIGVEIEDLAYLGMLENIYTANGNKSTFHRTRMNG